MRNSGGKSWRKQEEMGWRLDKISRILILVLAFFFAMTLIAQIHDASKVKKMSIEAEP